MTRYGWRTSLADVYFVALMRAWLSNLALSYRWSYLGVVAGVLSAAICVAKAAEFELWALPQVRGREIEPSCPVIRLSRCWILTLWTAFGTSRGCEHACGWPLWRRDWAEPVQPAHATLFLFQ